MTDTPTAFLAAIILHWQDIQYCPKMYVAYARQLVLLSKIGRKIEKFSPGYY